MKKVISTVLALSMVLGTATISKAAGTATPLTPEQQEARQKYLPIHLEKMTQLTDLRAQTKTAVDNNNNLAKQIKDKVQSLKASQQNKDSIASIKATLQKNKDLVAQAKDLNNQRADAQAKFREAVKAKDTAAANDAKNTILNLNSQIESIRQQIKANSDSVKPLKDQITALRNSMKSLKDQIKPLEQQAKNLHDQIASEEQAKNQLWQTYKSNIQAKDYTTAATTLQSIIDAKTKILANIKASGDVLNNILGVVRKY
jgi:chromosome segregation ATPase